MSQRAMKSVSSYSGETSMNTKNCSLRLKVLTLVMNTADFINERATPTLSMNHAIFAPIAIFTTYIFMGVLIIGASQHEYPSHFLQIYALVTCFCVHMYLSIIVFRDLITSPRDNAAVVLNGVLPMLTIFVLLSDLIMILFSKRNASPHLPENPSQTIE